MQQKQPPHSIMLPQIAPQALAPRLTHCTSSAHREGGFRLECQQINDKLVIHNYGQGVAQPSLAFGSAYISSKMITIKKEDTKIKDVAVLGNLYNAVFTALELSKRGNRVNIYMDKLPLKKKEAIANGSSRGLQFWYSGDYDNCDPLKHQLVSKLSFEFLTECLLTNRYQSLKTIPLFCTGPRSEDVLSNVTDFISKDVVMTTVSFNSLKLQSCAYFKTIMIDTDLLMQELMTELRLRSINITQKKFSSLSQVLQLKEQIIYNCLGLENITIFGDKSVSEVQNLSISIANPNPIPNSNLVLWYSSENEQEEQYWIGINEKTVQISSKYKPGKNIKANMQQNVEQIVGKAYHYLKDRTVKPYKL